MRIRCIVLWAPVAAAGFVQAENAQLANYELSLVDFWGAGMPFFVLATVSSLEISVVPIAEVQTREAWLYLGTLPLYYAVPPVLA